MTMAEHEIRADLTAAFEAGLETKDIKRRIAWIDREGEDGAVPVYVTADGKIQVLGDVMHALEEQKAGPRRRQGVAQFAELESFIRYVNRFKQQPAVVFADIARMQVTAVLDYHPEGSKATDAGWLGHRAVYECPRSRQWKEWTGNDGKAMRQDVFAAWIEDHLDDLTSGSGKAGDYPAPAAVLEMARNLQVHTKGRFERSFNPTTGESSLVCKTENEASSTPIPRAFLLALPVFEGGELYRVEARMRLALHEGAPLFTSVLHRRAEIERDAFDGVRAKVATETKIPLFAGAPER